MADEVGGIPAPNRVGHPSKWDEWKDRLVVLQGMARDGAVNEDFAKRIGIGVSTWCEWKARYPELREAIKESSEDVDRSVENALLKRARGYEYTETKVTATKDGKVLKVEKVTKHSQPSDVAAFFWLKNRNPARYRDRREFVEDREDQLAAVIAAIRDNLNSDDLGEKSKKVEEEAAELLAAAERGAEEGQRIEAEADAQAPEDRRDANL